MSNLRKAARDAAKAAGGGAALAKHLKLQRQAVYMWQRVPADHVLKVSDITGIPAHVLRPDLYLPPHRGSAA